MSEEKTNCEENDVFENESDSISPKSSPLTEKFCSSCSSSGLWVRDPSSDKSSASTSHSDDDEEEDDDEDDDDNSCSSEDSIKDDDETTTNNNISSPKNTKLDHHRMGDHSPLSSSNNAEPISSQSSDTRRRVKLYMLNSNRTWDDRGTGHVSSSYVDRLNGMSLLVKAETDGSTLLESRILADTAYQKQQDTLIVWSEGENYDLALSFQERIGCEEIWTKICQVQGKDPSVDVTQDLIEEEDNDLPPVESARLEEINSIVSASLSTQTKKENITLALENDNYIAKLLSLFREMEQKQDVCSLQKLYDIFRNLFLLNKSSLFDAMLSEQSIWDVIGVFEYDPSGARVHEFNQKLNKKSVSHLISKLNEDSSSNVETENSSDRSSAALHQRQSSSRLVTTTSLSSHSNSYFSSLPSSSETELMRLIREKRHREFLRNVSRFKEVIPLSKSELVAKIHQTYRVQYIQDVIMPTPSVFEDNLLSTLSSVLFYNKIEIVNMIQDDEKFLKELFRQLQDSTVSFHEKRRDLVLFLKELCTFSHTLQSRETFIKTLSSLGLLQTIESLLVCSDLAIKLGAVDILTYVVDYSASMLREYALQQEINTDKPTEQYIINLIIEQMICDTDADLGLAQQLSGILKLIIDPDNMLTTPALNKTEKSEFLNYFYKHCIYFLTSPILAATSSIANLTNDLGGGHADNSDSKLLFENSSQAAQLLAIILELLTFCVEHHAFHIRGYLFQKEIVQRIMYLTKSRHTFLVLTVIRFMRRLIGLKDEFYNRHIVESNLFQPIIDAFLSNNGRYNLLDSAVLDMFEFIDQQNIYSLLIYTIEKFWHKKLDQIDYVRTFKNMHRHYTNKIKDQCNRPSMYAAQRNRFRRDPRDLDKSEDIYFSTEEDDDEEECPDDDEDEECEPYHEEDDGLPSPPTTSIADRLLNESMISTVNLNSNNPTTISINSNSSHHTHYSLHGKSSLTSGGSAASTPSLHQQLHHLQSLHHQISSSSASSGNTINLSGYSYGNNNANSTSSAGYEATVASAFVDSPFFSALTSSNSNITSGGNKKRLNERKMLTININTKQSSILANVSNSSNNRTSATATLHTFTGSMLNHLQQQPSPSSQQSSASVLGAFSSGLFTSSNSVLSANPNSNNVTFRQTAHQILGQTLHQLKTDSSTILSRKALVDYPDEDSDEDNVEEDDSESDEITNVTKLDSLLGYHANSNNDTNDKCENDSEVSLESRLIDNLKRKQPEDNSTLITTTTTSEQKKSKKLRKLVIESEEEEDSTVCHVSSSSSGTLLKANSSKFAPDQNQSVDKVLIEEKVNFNSLELPFVKAHQQVGTNSSNDDVTPSSCDDSSSQSSSSNSSNSSSSSSSGSTSPDRSSDSTSSSGKRFSLSDHLTIEFCEESRQQPTSSITAETTTTISSSSNTKILLDENSDKKTSTR